MYNRTAYSLDASGEIKMKFTVPIGDRDEFHSIIVDYQGVISEVGKIPSKHLHSKNYITAKVLNDRSVEIWKIHFNYLLIIVSLFKDPL